MHVNKFNITITIQLFRENVPLYGATFMPEAVIIVSKGGGGVHVRTVPQSLHTTDD